MEKNCSKNKKIEIQVEGNNLQQVKSFKYLGVLPDKCLTYNLHINVIIRNTSHRNFLLNRVKRYLTTKSCILILYLFISFQLYITSWKDKTKERMEQIGDHRGWDVRIIYILETSVSKFKKFYLLFQNCRYIDKMKYRSIIQ